MKNMKRLIYLIIVFLVLGFVMPDSVLAVGQMTQPIIIDNALRGQEISAVLILNNSADDPITYELKAVGDDETTSSEAIAIARALGMPDEILRTANNLKSLLTSQ